MKVFLLALQFLTIIPVKIEKVKEADIAASMVCFPFVGLLLGFLLAGINNLLLSLKFEELAVSIILIVSLIIFTGGLHLDGLSDTADALFSGKDKEKRLEIMRDSHAGVMGILSLICVILLKIVFLSSINTSLKIVSLILMCTLSRWSLVFLMFLFPYARQEGKAKVFIEKANFKIFVLATMIALVCSVITWQLKGLFIIAITSISAYAIGKFITNKIGGITGDTLGAINELTEVIILLSICILERTNSWII